MLRKSTFLILGLLCIIAIIQAQELTDEANTEVPLVVQESNSTSDNSTESGESTESKESKEKETYEEVTPKNVLTCGLRNSNGISGISDDSITEMENTKFGEFPWLVSLSEEIEVEVYNFACTGALIGPATVVTTAHCVQQFVSNPKSLVITAGVWNSSIVNEEYATQIRYAKKIVLLEHFERNFHMNDIAVVILETPLDLKDHIQPICLPAVTESFDEQNCLLNYWEILNGNMSSKKAELSVVSSKKCSAKLNELKATQDLPIHESIVCAIGEKNIGDCDKQLGAPLICPVPGMIDRYYLAGLTSIGYGCNDGGYVGLFVNVALLSRWIVASEISGL